MHCALPFACVDTTLFKSVLKNRIGSGFCSHELAKKVENEHASSCLSWLCSLLEVGGDRILLSLNFPLSSKWTEGWGPGEGPRPFTIK